MTEATTSRSFAVRHVGDIGVIEVNGDVTPTSEDALTAAFTQAAKHSSAGVVLDFTGLDYMNSGGIGLLVTLLVRAQRNKQHLAAYGLSDHYRQIFQLTRLDDAITLRESESDAVAAAAGTRS